MMKRNILAVVMVIALALSGSLTVLNAEATDVHPSRVVDEADILTDAEESNLLLTVDEISERQQFDVVIVTVESLDGEDIQYYAADYYDYNGYGMGDNYDGAMFLISMEEREWFVLTTGYGIDVLTDAEIDDMSEDVVPYLSDGDYETAFSMFADYCDKQVAYENGDYEESAGDDIYYEDVYYEADSSYDSGSRSGSPGIVLSVIIGMALAFVPVLIMGSQLKSVHMQSSAGGYEKRNTRKITVSRDTFLYHTVNRVPRPKESSNRRGGSSTFRGSSGRSHGGRGGGF